MKNCSVAVFVFDADETLYQYASEGVGKFMRRYYRYDGVRHTMVFCFFFKSWVCFLFFIWGGVNKLFFCFWVKDSGEDYNKILYYKR